MTIYEKAFEALTLAGHTAYLHAHPTDGVIGVGLDVFNPGLGDAQYFLIHPSEVEAWADIHETAHNEDI